MALKVFEEPPAKWQGAVITGSRKTQNGKPLQLPSGEPAVLIKLRKEGENLGWFRLGLSEYESYRPVFTSRLSKEKADNASNKRR